MSISLISTGKGNNNHNNNYGKAENKEENFNINIKQSTVQNTDIYYKCTGMNDMVQEKERNSDCNNYIRNIQGTRNNMISTSKRDINITKQRRNKEMITWKKNL